MQMVAVMEHRLLNRALGRVFCGFGIAMIGVVAYCLAMPSVDGSANFPGSLSLRPVARGTALALILAGAGLWFSGCVGLLAETERLAPQTGLRRLND